MPPESGTEGKDKENTEEAEKEKQDEPEKNAEEEKNQKPEEPGSKADPKVRAVVFCGAGIQLDGLK